MREQNQNSEPVSKFSPLREIGRHRSRRPLTSRIGGIADALSHVMVIKLHEYLLELKFGIIKLDERFGYFFLK